MKIYQLLSETNFRYYLLICLAGLLAFFPVSFMIFSLKNDIVAIDYPIKYFISQCLQNHVQPFWINTWDKGFPLESILTWSFFSPLQFLIGILFPYNLYTLQAEFVFYIVLSGFGMFTLLQKQVTGNKDIIVLLSISYMLSGFTVGSSQWMTYLTAQALLPWVLHFFLVFLRVPSFRTSFLLVAIYYVMLTSVYPAFTIIFSYLLVTIAIVYLFRKRQSDQEYFSRTKIWRYLCFTLLLMVTTYSTCLYYSMQVLSKIDRGMPLAVDSNFSRSNFLHPKGLITLLLPFSSTRIQVPNTEGTMMDCYTGLMAMLLLPLSLIQNIRNNKKQNLLLLSIAFGFILLSFGHLTPFRKLLNVLPGFSYFRNPALFRLFFLLFLVLYLARTFAGSSLTAVFSARKLTSAIWLTTLSLAVFFLCIAAANFQFLTMILIRHSSLKNTLGQLSYGHTLLISSVLQLLLLSFFFIAIKWKKFKLLHVLVAFDLVINCLLCTPFFTVSSYSVKETNDHIFKATNGFPIQLAATGEVSTSVRRGQAIWYNVNVYKKKVSTLDSYFGPLTLKPEILPINKDVNVFKEKPVMFSTDKSATIVLEVQQPTHVSAVVKTKSPTQVILQQNFYPPWHAFLNGKEINIQQVPGAMKVHVFESGRLEFKYERNTLFIVAIIVNGLVVGTILLAFVTTLRKIPVSQVRNLEERFRMQKQKIA